MMQLEIPFGSTTLDALREQFKNLHYFDDELKPQNTDDWIKAKDNEAKRTQLILEMMFVNKLQVIGRVYEWEASHKDAYDEKRFYNTITNPKALTNEFGEIINEQGEAGGWGMAMLKDEFDVYKTMYDEIFDTEYLD